MQTGEIGTMFALIAGAGGAVGIYVTGLLADRVALKSEGWRMRILAIGLLISIPLLIATVSVENSTLAFFCYLMPAIAGAFQVGPCFALIQGRTPLNKRAVAASINLFIGNIIGLGIGPLYVGLVSDALQTSAGEASLGYAIGSLVVFYVVGACFFLVAARRIDREPHV